MKRNILIYEPFNTHAQYLAFVMSFGEVDYTHARTVAETLNWLEAVRLRIAFFDLILISSLSHEDSEIVLLGILPSVKIPLVFVQRDIDIPTELIKMNAIICTPANLHQWLQSWITINVS